MVLLGLLFVGCSAARGYVGAVRGTGTGSLDGTGSTGHVPTHPTQPERGHRISTSLGFAVGQAAALRTSVSSCLAHSQGALSLTVTMTGREGWGGEAHMLVRWVRSSRARVTQSQ